jgi:hypothetical protein
MRHNRGMWFTENQVSLLKELKAANKKYRMRLNKELRLKEVWAFIAANWNCQLSVDNPELSVLLPASDGKTEISAQTV